MFEGKRLCSSNIKQYINTTDPLKLIVVEDISPLLQKNYQGENNIGNMRRIAPMIMNNKNNY